MSFFSKLILSEGLFLLPSSPPWAGDVDDLKASLEHLLDSLEAKDLKGMLESRHPEAVVFMRDYMFPVDRTNAGEKIWEEIFSDFFRSKVAASIVPGDLEYRVVGNTGLVWGFTQTLIGPKNGTPRAKNSRLSVVFVKNGEKRQVLSWHASAPVEPEPREDR